MTIVEGDNYTTLLEQLEDPAKEIDTNLLLSCLPRTQPKSTGLLAHYGFRLQLAVIDFSWGLILGQVVVALGTWVALVNVLAPENVQAKDIMQILVSTIEQNWLLALTILLLLIIFTAFLRGKLTFFPGQLDFGLEGLFHLTPTGRCYTPWSRFTVVYRGWWNRIVLYQANGNYFVLYIFPHDGQCLVNLIERLIKRHQSDCQSEAQAADSTPS